MTKNNNLDDLLKQQKNAAFNIKGTASEINMIAINAAIESAHAAAGIRTMMEKVLDGMMTTVCRMITQMLDTGSFSLEQKELEEFANWVGIDEIYITDSDAVTVGSNLGLAYGWRFPDDPKAQAYVFRKLIESKDGVVTQPIKSRDLDSQMFKFVGVSRTDEPGIVQVGYRAENIAKYQVEIGAVFGILASEIKNLGGRVTSASKAMQEMTTELEKEIVDR
jgi:methyl-accepting chemotaxis protein